MKTSVALLVSCTLSGAVIERQLMPLPGSEQAGGVEVVRFVRTLSAASSLDQLKHGFLAGFGRLLGVPMYGYALVDPTGYPTCVATGNVSPTFVAKYEREAKDIDPVLAEAYDTGRPTYNLDLMSAEEWLESPVYRRAYSVHTMRHVVEVPVVTDGRITGNVHFGTSDPDWDFSANDIRLADALGGVLGLTLEAIESRERVERERDQALTVLDVAGTPFAVSDPLATDVRLNDAARRLLADVVDAEEHLHRLLARPATSGGWSRRIDVELTTGETGVIHGHLRPVDDEDGALVAVLELEREQPGIPRGVLASLTPREQEVAVLVVEGLADREIAERLCLSHHTVSQYVKRIYRKLDVDSRVALTRLLLGPHNAIRRS
jgi:DNA-binding CsgD family transcriptional regulator